MKYSMLRAARGTDGMGEFEPGEHIERDVHEQSQRDLKAAHASAIDETLKRKTVDVFHDLEGAAILNSALEGADDAAMQKPSGERSLIDEEPNESSVVDELGPHGSNHEHRPAALDFAGNRQMADSHPTVAKLVEKPKSA